MLRDHKWLRWSWFLLTLVFLAFRFQNIQGVLSQTGVTFNDTDPYYRLHRIQTMLVEQRFYPLHDDTLSSPRGLDVPWPTGLDILIAFPLEVYQSFSRVEIESFSAIVIPFLSLPILWASGWIGTYLGGPLTGLFLGVLVTLCPTILYQSSIGRVDHHFLESLLPIVLLMFILKFKQTQRRYHWAWLVMIMGLAPSFAPQGWIIGPLFLLGLLFENDWKTFHTYSKIFFQAFLVSLIFLSFSDRFYQGYFRWISFSWWAPWSYLCCSVLLEIIFSFFKSEKQDKTYKWILGFFFASVMIFLVSKNPISFIQDNVSNAFYSVSARSGTLATTLEARSISSMSTDFWLRSDFHIVMISVICFLFFLVQKRYLFLLGYSLIPLYLSFYQIRFITFSIALLCLLVLLFFHELTQKIKIKALYRQLVFLGIVVLMIIPIRPTFAFYHVGNVHRYYEPVRRFCFFLNKEFKRLHRKKDKQAILAHWDYGHWLLYYTGLPVISDPFQGQSAYEVMQLFTSEGTDELKKFEQKYPSNYILIESGAMRSFRWIETVGKDKDLYFKKVSETAGNEYFETTEAFDKLFMFRFFFELGRGLDNNHPQHWRLIYISPYPSPLDPDISALKVFERVNGVTIHAHSQKKYDELFLEARILEKDDPTYFKQKSTGKHDFEWVVPYGIYNQGDVAFDGAYVVHDAKGNVIHIIQNITEEQVLRGDKIDVRF